MSRHKTSLRSPYDNGRIKRILRDHDIYVHATKQKLVASLRKAVRLVPKKKINRHPSSQNIGPEVRQRYRAKVDPELLSKADQYKTFHIEALADCRKAQRRQEIQHNDFVFGYQDEKKSISSNVFRLPLPNQRSRATIDMLTLTRGTDNKTDDPDYLFKLIQGHYTWLPQEFAHLQNQAPLWIFCFEKTEKILAELVHASLHDQRDKRALLRIQVDFETTCRGPKQRKKLSMEPHAELLALGLNLGLNRKNVTVADRAEFLDDYCGTCPPWAEETGDGRHPLTSTNRLWLSLLRLRDRFCQIPHCAPQGRIDGLSVAAWQGLQQMKTLTFRHPNTFWKCVTFRLETSESLSAEQRCLQKELREMDVVQHEALTARFASGVRILV